MEKFESIVIEKVENGYVLREDTAPGMTYGKRWIFVDHKSMDTWIKCNFNPNPVAVIADGIGRSGEDPVERELKKKGVV